MAEFRTLALACLPEKAFLRRDRGEGLFITNAPMFGDALSVCARLEAAGFRAETVGGLIRICAGGALMRPYECLPPENDLSRSLQRFRGLPVEQTQIDLFTLIAKAREGDETVPYDMRLRKQAAYCLRKGGGGGLYACAVLAAKIHEKERPL